MQSTLGRMCCLSGHLRILGLVEVKFVFLQDQVHEQCNSRYRGDLGERGEYPEAGIADQKPKEPGGPVSISQQRNPHENGSDGPDQESDSCWCQGERNIVGQHCRGGRRARRGITRSHDHHDHSPQHSQKRPELKPGAPQSQSSTRIVFHIIEQSCNTSENRYQSALTLSLTRPPFNQFRWPVSFRKCGHNIGFPATGDYRN